MSFDLALMLFSPILRRARFFGASKIVSNSLLLAALFGIVQGQTNPPINKTNSPYAVQCAGTDLPNKNLQSERHMEKETTRVIQQQSQQDETDPSHKLFTPIVRQLFGDDFILRLKELKALTDSIYQRKDNAGKSELLRARAALLTTIDETFLARADLQTALGLSALPTEERVRVKLQLANLYRASGRPTAAAEMFESILIEEPENPVAQLARGELALASGDEITAQNAATKLLARLPGDAKAKLLLAETLIANNLSGQAQRLLQEVKNDANAGADLRAMAAIRLAEYFAGQGDFLTAGGFAREAASLSPISAERSAKLRQTISEAGSLQNQIKAISGRCQVFPLELSVQAARFNDAWAESSTNPQFSSEAVNVSGFAQTARIAFPGRTGGLTYYTVDENRPLEIEVEGPTMLRLTTRPVHNQLNAQASLKVLIEENGKQRQRFNIDRNTASSEVVFADLQGITPGVAEQLELHVPAGVHRYRVMATDGTVFMRAAAMKRAEFDFLVGNVSSMSWWARAFAEFERTGNRSSVAAVESRYRLFGDTAGAYAALNQIPDSVREYHWYRFAAELESTLGNNPVLHLIQAAVLAPNEQLAKNAFIAGISHYKNSGAIDSALATAALWLNAHPEDAEIRTQVAALKLSKGEDFAVEAWVEAELARPFAEAEKLAEQAERKSRWERRSSAASSAGSDTLKLFRAESSSQFRAVREALLAPVFEPGTAQIVSQFQYALIQTDVSQTVNLRARVYVENVTPVDNLVAAQQQSSTQSSAAVQPTFALMEVTLDGQRVNTINIPYKTLTEIELPAIPPGEHLLRIGFLEENPVAGQPEQTQYAQVQIENTITGQAIMPQTRTTQLVATSSEPVLLNAFAPGVLRIALRSITRLKESGSNGAVVTIKPKSGGQTSAFPVQFPKTSVQTALAYDSTATVGDAREILVILPASADVFKIEVRPLSGQILVNPYDARGEKQVLVKEESAPGVVIGSITDYLKPSTVIASPPFPNINYQILDDRQMPAALFGLFTFYARFDNERTITFEEGERVSNARNYIEQGIIHRKAFPNLRLYTRTIAAERTLFPAIPVFRFENEASQNRAKFGVNWNTRFRAFAQPTEGGAASFRFDGSVGRPFRFRSYFLTVTPSIGYFRVWQTLNGNMARDLSRVSRDVYLRFYETHPQGLYLQSSFTYMPFTDTLFSGSIRATTNPSLSLTDFDRLRLRARFVHLLMEGKLELGGNFTHTVRFADRNRANTEHSNQFEGRAEYGWWTKGGRRVEFGGGLRWATEYNRPDFFLEFRIDINRSNGFTEFDPSDISFEEQRLRTLNRQPAIRRVEQ
ncbi:MAG: hypothetical protein LC768_10740 [Acidobacteria bacterium]|nr:hypothetical protein [Acidobacteriota bacterium]MCA1638790.1 hypothetical protein [Acidobacteriota bacterium]